MDSGSNLGADDGDARTQARNMALAQAVGRVEAILGVTGEPVARPLLVVLCGLPGSGKSFLARRLQPHLSAVIVETDYVRHILFAKPLYTGGENAWVYAVCHALIARLLSKSYPVIFDATNLVERNREVLYNMADRMHAKLVLVHVVAPEETIRERLLDRMQHPHPGNHSHADISVYEMMRPREQPIRRQHLVIDTTGDSEQAVRRILRECRT